MKLNRWSWGYIPVALVLGLIWFEFWHSGAFKSADPSPSDTPDTAVADTTPAPTPATPATPATPTPIIASGTGAGTGRTPVVPVAPPLGVPEPAPAVPAKPAALVIDDAFLHNPPPITVSFSGQNLSGAAAAIQESFHMPSTITVQTPNNNQNVYTLEAKEKPFWEVIRSLEAQGAFGFAPSGAGLTLSTSYSPNYHFEISGPAILYATAAVYNRTVSAQSPTDRQPGNFQITFGAAVDPRISISRTYPVEIIEAVDENGRPLPLNGQMGGTTSGNRPNSWISSAVIPESTPRPHALSLKCQVRFAALQANETITVEDATSKQGDLITVGDRKLRLTRCEIQGTTLAIQITPEDGNPASNISCTLIGSGGQTSSFNITSGSVTHSYPSQIFGTPCRLSFRDSTAGQELAFLFDLKDIPLP